MASLKHARRVVASLLVLPLALLGGCIGTSTNICTHGQRADLVPTGWVTETEEGMNSFFSADSTRHFIERVGTGQYLVKKDPADAGMRWDTCTIEGLPVAVVHKPTHDVEMDFAFYPLMRTSRGELALHNVRLSIDQLQQAGFKASFAQGTTTQPEPIVDTSSRTEVVRLLRWLRSFQNDDSDRKTIRRAAGAP